MTISFEKLLTGWITDQRWFAGKGRAIDELTIESDTELVSGDPALHHLIIAVRQGTDRDRYQLLVGHREELPPRLKHVRIGPTTYDAAHDADLTGALLYGMAENADVGRIRFRRMDEVTIDASPRSLVIGAEQSNTSLVYGDAYICKMFRRLTPGINPELEIVTALARRGAPHIARPYGWIETDIDGRNTTLAITQEFLPTANDGWALALASVRDLYASLPEITADQAGGDFAAESFRLGTATAHVHREMAAAFPTDIVEAPDLKQLAELFRRRLRKAADQVPELAEHVDMVDEVYDRLADLPVAVPVQRVHGDYHLGQVMRTPTDWIILDFEGEPGQPLDDRRTLASPLRDVAGMLRSYDYAARHLLAGNPDAESLEHRADEWAGRNRSAFLSGYAEGGGAIDGAENAVLLRALELGKAVYEVIYEARNRPTWLPIPLAAFRPSG